jgi:hypothetical protein
VDVRDSRRGGAIDGEGGVLQIQLPGLIGAGKRVGGDVAHVFLLHQFFQGGGAALIVVGKAVWARSVKRSSRKTASRPRTIIVRNIGMARDAKVRMTTMTVMVSRSENPGTSAIRFSLVVFHLSQFSRPAVGLQNSKFRSSQASLWAPRVTQLLHRYWPHIDDHSITRTGLIKEAPVDVIGRQSHRGCGSRVGPNGYLQVEAGYRPFVCTQAYLGASVMKNLYYLQSEIHAS